MIQKSLTDTDSQDPHKHSCVWGHKGEPAMHESHSKDEDHCGSPTLPLSENGTPRPNPVLRLKGRDSESWGQKERRRHPTLPSRGQPKQRIPTANLNSASGTQRMRSFPVVSPPPPHAAGGRKWSRKKQWRSRLPRFLYTGDFHRASSPPALEAWGRGRERTATRTSGWFCGDPRQGSISAMTPV